MFSNNTTLSPIALLSFCGFWATATISGGVVVVEIFPKTALLVSIHSPFKNKYFPRFGFSTKYLMILIPDK